MIWNSEIRLCTLVNHLLWFNMIQSGISIMFFLFLQRWERSRNYSQFIYRGFLGSYRHTAGIFQHGLPSSFQAHLYLQGLLVYLEIPLCGGRASPLCNLIIYTILEASSYILEDGHPLYPTSGRTICVCEPSFTYIFNAMSVQKHQQICLYLIFEIFVFSVPLPVFLRRIYCLLIQFKYL